YLLENQCQTGPGSGGEIRKRTNGGRDDNGDQRCVGDFQAHGDGGFPEERRRANQCKNTYKGPDEGVHPAIQKVQIDVDHGVSVPGLLMAQATRPGILSKSSCMKSTMMVIIHGPSKVMVIATVMSFGMKDNVISLT